jgi:hypothetical protein
MKEAILFNPQWTPTYKLAMMFAIPAVATATKQQIVDLAKFRILQLAKEAENPEQVATDLYEKMGIQAEDQNPQAIAHAIMASPQFQELTQEFLQDNKTPPEISKQEAQDLYENLSISDLIESL